MDRIVIYENDFDRWRDDAINIYHGVKTMHIVARENDTHVAYVEPTLEHIGTYHRSYGYLRLPDKEVH